MIHTVVALHPEATEQLKTMLALAGHDPDICDGNSTTETALLDSFVSTLVQSTYRYLPTFKDHQEGAIYYRMPWGQWSRNGQLVSLTRTEELDRAYGAFLPACDIKDFVPGETSDRMNTLLMNRPTFTPDVHDEGTIRRALTDPSLEQCPHCFGVLYASACERCRINYLIGHEVGCPDEGHRCDQTATDS